MIVTPDMAIVTPTDVAVDMLRRASGVLEDVNQELSAGCANAADGLRLATRGRCVILPERDPACWKIDVRLLDRHQSRAWGQTPASVLQERLREADARVALNALEQRAECNDPSLPRPLRIRLWRGDELKFEVEWR